MSNVVRRRGLLVLVVAAGMAFLVPAAWSVERVVGPVGLASTDLVDGFFAGFDEVLRWSGALAVLLPLAVGALWARVHPAAAREAVPGVGAAVAACAGLYAGRGVGAAVRQAPTPQRGHQ